MSNNLQKPRIYDCFMFFNELDLLEIRLAELYDSVDYFVLVEAPFTHSGQSKPLYYQENKDRYKKWSNKIIHVICANPPQNLLDSVFTSIENNTKNLIIGKIFRKFNLGRWKLETFQRNCLLQGIKKANIYDIIFISDADEIINPKVIERIKRILTKFPDKIIRLQQEMYYYFLNGHSREPWESAKACTYKTLKFKIKKPDYIRNWPIIFRFLSILNIKPFEKKEIIISNGGWHFSYQGGVEMIIKKIENLAHSENDLDKIKDKNFIIERIKTGKNLVPGQPPIKYVSLDNSFPNYLIMHRRKFKNLIMEIK